MNILLEPNAPINSIVTANYENDFDELNFSRTTHHQLIADFQLNDTDRYIMMCRRVNLYPDKSCFLYMM